ncbi:MAG: hypothetical protein ABMB14_31515 [Myxococcota bacterium]
MASAAFPFIDVRIDTAGLAPIATRSPGVVAVVGVSDKGTAPVGVPQVVSSNTEAAELFAGVNPDGTVVDTPLSSSLALVFAQDPRPSKVYGVKVGADGHAAGLAALESLDDPTFVALAGVTAIGSATGGLVALKDHVHRASADGRHRIGVAMVDPARARTPDYVDLVVDDYEPLKSDSGRMVLVAARGAVGDVASAAMGAMAGHAPHISILLKRIRGITIPIEQQFTASEIVRLSEANIDPILDPTLIPGTGLHFGDGRTFTSDESLLYVDIRRTLDDLNARLKAGLIGLVGDARITKSGMIRLKMRIEGVLDPLLRDGVIAGYAIDVPVLAILSVPESAWSAGDRAIVETARANRAVDAFVSVTYGPAVHRLQVTLAMRF